MGPDQHLTAPRAICVYFGGEVNCTVGKANLINLRWLQTLVTFYSYSSHQRCPKKNHHIVFLISTSIAQTVEISLLTVGIIIACRVHFCSGTYLLPEIYGAGRKYPLLKLDISTSVSRHYFKLGSHCMQWGEGDCSILYQTPQCGAYFQIQTLIFNASLDLHMASWTYL